jgi:hypothetical protein
VRFPRNLLLHRQGNVYVEVDAEVTGKKKAFLLGWIPASQNFMGGERRESAYADPAGVDIS